MTTCAVLRCPETPTDVFRLVPGSDVEVPICGRHKVALDSGARWMVHGATVSTLGNGHEGSEGVRILMSGDLPEYNRVFSFGVSRIIGDESGFALELDIDAGHGQQRFSFWLPEEAGKRLGSFLADPSKPPAPPAQ